MNCEKYKNLISDLVEGELDSQTAKQVNLHVFSCRNCEAEFETLSSEKKMYSHFLFEVEPPKDLSTRFQARLEAENYEKNSLQNKAFSFNDWYASLFLKSGFAVAVILIAFASCYFWLMNSAYNHEKTIASEPRKSEDTPTVNQQNKYFTEEKPNTATPEVVKIKTTAKQKVKNEIEQVSFIKIKAVETKPTIVLTNAELAKKPVILKNKPQNFVELPKINNENEARFKQIQAFELETAKQLEKVEMLLRAFRNVRYVEGGEEYDVEYEKQQAGKLLAKNVQLRQQAENYGTTFTTEMLSIVEPYLLDISNLDANPTEEEVLEIKQRVKNQNIIVSLQSF